MKKQILTLSLAILVLIFNGCSGKEYSIGDIKIPRFAEKRLDKKLPRVQGLKAVTDMSQVALEWQPIIDKQIAGYRIFRGDSRNRYKLIATLSDRYESHFTDNNLNPNIKYTYKISVYTKDGRVSMTSTTETAITKDRLVAPIIIEASKALPKRIKLIWRIHPNELTRSYIIEKKRQGERDFSTIANLKGRLTVEYIDKDIQPAQIYHYKLRAKSYNGIVSAPSKTVSGYAKKLPNMITWIKATDNRPRLIDIIWKPTNAPEKISHYNIYSSTLKNTLFTFLASTKEPKYTDKFDSDGITRYYKVAAVDHDGLESPQNLVATMGKTIGASRGPIINSATVKNNAIFLKWSDPDGKARRYTVVKKYWDGWRAKKIKITDFRSTKFTDTKIAPNTQYTYYIISVDKFGIESMPSKEVVLSINDK